MNEIFAVLLFILCDHGAFATKGMYCIGGKRSWLNSMRTCNKLGGTPIPYIKGRSIVPDLQHIHESIWTANFVRNASNADFEQLCGFRHKSWSWDNAGQVYFGDCNGTKLYICLNSETMIAEIRKGSYKSALETCKVVNQSVIDTISNFQRGYYWMKNTILVKRITFYDKDGTAEKYGDINPFKCGAYSVDAGQYFRNCFDMLLSLCHFADPPKDTAYWSCINASETSTKSSTLSTSVAEPITSISARTQPVNQSENTDDGKVVGLSVGICLALICGIILSIYISRRYKCWKTIDIKDTQSPGVTYYRDQVQFHINNSYEDTENSTTKKLNRVTNKPEKSNASEVVNAPVYAAVDKAKVHHNNLARNEMYPNNKKINGQSSDSMKNEIYSFAKETKIEINHDGKGNGINDDEYDVAGNVQGKSEGNSNNVYNSLGNEEYNTVANVKGVDKFDNVYNRTQRQRESYYASTSQVSNSTPCDNVYNHLS